MTPNEFCYWLQGFFDLSQTVPSCGLTQEQANVVRKHLSLVFARAAHTGDAGSILSPGHYEGQGGTLIC